MTFVVAYGVVAGLIYVWLLWSYRDEGIGDLSTLVGLAIASVLWPPLLLSGVLAWFGLALLALLADLIEWKRP